jgi:hypothetical protein
MPEGTNPDLKSQGWQPQPQISMTLGFTFPASTSSANRREELDFDRGVNAAA